MFLSAWIRLSGPSFSYVIPSAWLLHQVLRVFSALIKKEKNKITDKIVSSSSFESFKFPQ